MWQKYTSSTVRSYTAKIDILKMRIKLKLILTFLITGLTGAIIMAAIANWLIVRDFNESIKKQAFSNFKLDVQHYLNTYGGLQQALSSEPFHIFTNRARNQRESNTTPTQVPHQRVGAPPFKFLLIKPTGEILNPVHDNAQVSQDELKNAYPIMFRGEVALYASPVGEPNFSAQDQHYLNAVKQALVTGVIAASAVAIIIGIILGNRITETLEKLTQSIKSIQDNKEGHYFIANTSSDELGDVIRAFNQMNRDLSSAHKELRELSIRDELTGLYNRRHFSEQAEKAFEHSIRYKQSLSVMIGDVDNFKKINDTLTHSIGDFVLRALGNILTSNTRKSDIVARYGGEEFVIVFPSTSYDKALLTCENLREAIESYDWKSIDSSLSVTISMGLCSDLSVDNIDQMINIADKHLMLAKDSGKNQLIGSPSI